MTERSARSNPADKEETAGLALRRETRAERIALP